MFISRDVYLQAEHAIIRYREHDCTCHADEEVHICFTCYMQLVRALDRVVREASMSETTAQG
jgi:hypothetical protein